jgi:primosomal protein N'
MKLTKAEIARLRKVQDGIDRKIQKTSGEDARERLEQQWRDIEQVIKGRVATHVEPKKEATEAQLKKLDALERKINKIGWDTARGKEMEKKYDAMYKKLRGHVVESALPAALKKRVKKLASAVVKKRRVVKKKKAVKKPKRKVMKKPKRKVAKKKKAVKKPLRKPKRKVAKKK